MNRDRWELMKISVTSLIALVVVLSFYLYKSKLHIAKLESSLFLAQARVQELKKLEKINDRQKIEISRLNNETEKLKSKIEDLENLSKQVQTLAEKTLKIDLLYKRGQRKYSSRGSNISLEEVRKKINKLDNTVETQKDNLSQIKSQLEILYEWKYSVPSGRPVLGCINSDFGYRRRSFHTGVDIRSSIGTPVKATANGIVSYAGRRSGYGLTVIIRHNFGFSTLYAHLSKILVSVGKRVERGDVIGYSGMTGYTTGPHLHYEVRINDKPVDPRDYL
ncbi:MAG: peptidoglycan DD-metalloendopeptidase family protein [bacterium]|nr:peptidoglycan DD-metalloendopeptidase family protein [bacterium]